MANLQFLSFAGVSGYDTGMDQPNEASAKDVQPVALVTGVGGQDGSYLTEFLLKRGYEVHGMTPRATSWLPLDPRVAIHHGDLVEGSNLLEILDRTRPTEVYNLGAQSHVKLSFELPVYTGLVTGLGTLRLLEAIRQYQNRAAHPVRFYQASSSEMFGKTPLAPQNEDTPFHPRSPYACAKPYAYWQTINYREAYGLFACNGILFTHESPRRGE